MNHILRQRKAIQQLGAERHGDEFTYNITQNRSNCPPWNLKAAPGPMAESSLAQVRLARVIKPCRCNWGLDTGVCE